MSIADVQSSQIDRESLGLSAPYAAPNGELETLITRIFAEVFTLDRVGIDDDFFDIGGDSLLAEVLSVLVSQRTGHDFRLSSLVEYGSPRRIASLIETSSNGVVTSAAAADQQTRPPIFVVHGRGGYTLPSPQFCQALAEGQKLRMFEFPGLRGGGHFQCVEDIAAAYVEQLNQDYPRGPVLLASFCAGGLIALEMAKQLAAARRPVAHLVLIDPPIRRNGTLGISNSGGGPPYVTTKDWLGSMLRRLLPQFVRRRLLELKYRRHELKKRKKRARYKYSGFPLSVIKPRADLQFAFAEYRPQRHEAQVTILASCQREPVFRHGPYVANILPRRTVHVVADCHRDIILPRSAQAMQAAFDAALVKN